MASTEEKSGKASQTGRAAQFSYLWKDFLCESLYFIESDLTSPHCSSASRGHVISVHKVCDKMRGISTLPAPVDHFTIAIENKNHLHCPAREW
jgi:hypothetical protein